MRPGASVQAANLPAVAQPMLATLVDAPFDDDDWVFEIKWDGVRAICTVQADGQVKLISRNGKDLLRQFPELERLKSAFRKRPLLADGEVVSLDRHGKSSFQRLQGRLNRARPSDELLRSTPVNFVAFDLLYADGEDMRREPLLTRKAALLDAIRPGQDCLLYSKHVAGCGKKLFAQAERRSLEGIIGKRVDSPYVETRSRNWVKIKTQRRQECVIGGWTDPRGSRSHFGALLLGLYDEAGLTYVGHVGTGFDRERLQELMGKLRPLETGRCPFTKTPKTNSPCHWVKPDLVAEIKFGEWTSDGIMRQPVFLGLRTDKRPEECRREVPARAKAVRAKR